ncbi:MAG: amidase [Actinobacteria bacterium]|nr:amidase [Actinomycetota bacterium]
MHDLPAELWKWDAADLAAGIRSRSISSREAVSACLRRIEDVDSVLNAVAVVLHDEALAAADEADSIVSKGEALELLHGVPVTTKLNADQAGTTNNAGVVSFKNRVAEADNPAIGNLRAAGAILIGRTNTPPFCMRWETENDLYGRTLNPWSADHVPGGSTGGGAAAVAAGMSPLAQGSDCGGSIRYPSFCNGITGLRPTPGRVPNVDPSLPAPPIGVQLTSVAGPIARRVRDLRLGLEVMARRDPRDPRWVPVPLQGQAPQMPIKVALCRDPNGDGVDSTVSAALDRAAEALTDSGYEISEPSSIPSLREAGDVWDVILQGEGRSFLEDTVAKLADPAMRTATRYMINRVAHADLDDLVAAYIRRAELRAQWSVHMEEYPLLLSPVSTVPQFKHGEDIQSQAANDRSYLVQSPLTGLALIGVPGVAVPTGLVADLPTGVLLSGPQFREDLCLDAAAVVEAAYPMETPLDPSFVDSAGSSVGASTSAG